MIESVKSLMRGGVKMVAAMTISAPFAAITAAIWCGIFPQSAVALWLAAVPWEQLGGFFVVGVCGVVVCAFWTALGLASYGAIRKYVFKRGRPVCISDDTLPELQSSLRYPDRIHFHEIWDDDDDQISDIRKAGSEFEVRFKEGSFWHSVPAGSTIRIVGERMITDKPAQEIG